MNNGKTSRTVRITDISHTSVVRQCAIGAPESLAALPRRARAKDFLEGLKIVDAVNGKVAQSQNATALFNPASNTKLATSLVVLRKFGSEYRFATEIRTNGPVSSQGELLGDLFVGGQYMLFGDKQALHLAQLLNDRGIRTVRGDLIISSELSMNLHLTGLDAGARLLSILDPNHGKKPAGRGGRSRRRVPAGVPSISILGELKINSAPADSTLMATHFAPPLRDILKIMLCYSDNTMAERFGTMFGGADALTKFVLDDVGVPAGEARFASTSGLGINRVSPRAMLQVLTALRDELKETQLSLSDILCVTGIDEGTMKDRLNSPSEAGTVMAKTGTLTETDQGASALAGQICTTNGDYLFVIFEMHGDVQGFRHRQDTLVAQFQADNSEAKAIVYTTILPRIDGEDYWR